MTSRLALGWYCAVALSFLMGFAPALAQPMEDPRMTRATAEVTQAIEEAVALGKFKAEQDAAFAKLRAALEAASAKRRAAYHN